MMQKMSQMQRDVSVLRKDEDSLMAKTMDLETKEKVLMEHDQKTQSQLKDIEKREDADPWGQGDDFENDNSLKKEKAPKGSFAEFMDNLFG